MWQTEYQSQSSRGNAKTVLANFFALSIFGQFDYELESRILKSENRFHAQLYRIKCGTKCCWQIITFNNDPVGSPSGYFSPEIL
jgi:hypothetical protein